MFLVHPAALACADALAERGQAEAALTLWAALRDDPAAPSTVWLRPAALLHSLHRGDEAAALHVEARARCPYSRDAWVGWAAVAHDRRNWPEAERRWQQTRERFPDDLRPYVTAAAALRETRRFDAAAAVLAEAAQRFAGEPPVLLERAMLATARHDWPAAADAWQPVRELMPDYAPGYSHGGQALTDLRRFDAADSVLAEGLRRFPEDAAILLRYAITAERRGDPATAEHRFAELRRRHPNHWFGYTGEAAALRRLGRMNEAEALLREAIARLPQQSPPYAELARLAEANGDWPEAERRWTEVIERFPNAPEGPLGKALALSRQNRPAAADAVIEAAMVRFPNAEWLAIQHARNAVAREDLPLALERLEAAQRRFPDSDALRRQIYEIRLRIPAPTPAAAARDDDAALAMQFESLGGSGHGCEFGIFQRSLGAEPLGLLRWADLRPQPLIAALRTGLAGVGEPEFTSLAILPDNGRPEYWTTDTRYHMAMRCFVYPDEVPQERMAKLVRRRMRFLRDKLIEDLRQGSKIFVYKTMRANMTAEELADLHEAVRSYGDNTLFYIRYQDEAHPNGTVEMRGPGLMVGYIDHFSHAPDTRTPLGPVHPQFLALCRKAHALWRAGKTQRALPAAAAAT